MKFTLAIFAVLAIVGPLSAYRLPSTGSGELAKDLQDVVDMFPFDKVFDITKAYLAQDKDVQLMAALVASPDSKHLIHYIETEPAFKKLAAFVQEHGLDIYYLINRYNKFMHLPPFVPSVAAQREITGGIDGYFLDLVSVVPVNEMDRKLQDKLDSSKALSELVKLAGTPEILDFIHSLKTNEFFLKLENQADQNGIGRDNVHNYFAYFAAIVPVAKSVL